MFALSGLELESAAGLGKEVMLASTCSFLVSLDYSVFFPGDQKQQRFFSPYLSEGKNEVLGPLFSS